MSIKKILIFLLILFLRFPCFAETKYTHSAIDNILNRKSIRNFSNKKVEQEKINLILKSAMAAPSAMNKQPWEIVVVTDNKKLEQIAKYIPNASYSKASQLTIIVCGNTDISEKFWLQDCCAMTENILLAVEGLGLGAVWCAVYPFEDKVEKVKELFNLPKNIIPLNVIPIGYSAIKEKPKQKYDSKKIHTNNW